MIAQTTSDRVVRAEQLFDEHVFLTGRPPLVEFLNFVQSSTPDNPIQDLGPLTATWREANTRVVELEQNEAGIADSPAIDALSDELAGLGRELLLSPAIRRSFGVVPFELGVVNLEELIVFQKRINLRYVDELQRSLPSKPTDADIFRFCMASDVSRPPVRGGRVGQNQFIFTSASNDLRFLEVTDISPTDVNGYGSNGYPATIIGLVIGYGTNVLNAVHVEGRLILNNGSHRAYALKDLGVTHAPCLIQHADTREQISVIMNGAVPEHPERYLEASRPPLLKDYFDDGLRAKISVPRRDRQITVSFNVGQVDVPSSAEPSTRELLSPVSDDAERGVTADARN